MKAPIGVLFLALAALAIPAVAEEPRVDPVVVTGAVVSSANDSLVVDGDDGTRRTFLVDPATTLATADLTAGARVVVQYRVVDGDRAQALTVNLLDTGAPGASPSPAAATAPNADDGSASGPLAAAGPLPLVGLAVLGVVAAGLFVWVFVRRGHEEMGHLSL